MLALKTLAASDAAGKTLIFDEVDAGIGGRVADVVGAKLRTLGGRFQVLCITHLPQIAARGTTQFLIEKRVRGNRTVTSVERLDHAGRVEEIARMIGGAAVTEPCAPAPGNCWARRPEAKAKVPKGESESPKGPALKARRSDRR